MKSTVLTTKRRSQPRKTRSHASMGIPSSALEKRVNNRRKLVPMLLRGNEFIDGRHSDLFKYLCAHDDLGESGESVPKCQGARVRSDLLTGSMSLASSGCFELAAVTAIADGGLGLGSGRDLHFGCSHDRGNLGGGRLDL